MVYYLLLALLALCTLSRIVVPTDRWRQLRLTPFLIGLALLAFLVVGGLRHEVGADWEPYRLLYERLTSWSAAREAREEILFCTGMFLGRMAGLSYATFIFLLFLLSFGLKARIFRSHSPDLFLSLGVYAFTVLLIYDLNGMRQGLAIGILLQTIPFTLERRILPYLVLLAVASLCHISALIFAPMFWIARIELGNRKLLLGLPLILGGLLGLSKVLGSSAILQDLLSAERFLHYSVYTTDAYRNANENFLNAALLQRLTTFLLFLYYYPRMRAETPLKLLLRNGYLASVAIFTLLSFSSEFSARLGYYYKSLEMLMIPMVVWAPERKIERFLLATFFFALCAIGTSRLLSLPDGMLLPYRNLLTHGTTAGR